MRAEALAFAVAGILFGLIVGWMLGSQQARPAGIAAAPSPVAAAPAPAAAAAGGQPHRLDPSRVQELRTLAEQNPKDPAPRIQLGNLFFDAEQYTDSISLYQAALALNPKDPNVSTDLGVAYYYTNQPDRAISQFELSLSSDPKHTKTLLNLGIVKAFGKQDLAAAAKAWQEVVTLSPNSPEGQAAKKALEGIQAAHPGGGTPPSGKPIAVLRPLLLLLLVAFFARAVWRLLEGVVRGAIGPQGSAPAPECTAPRSVKMARDPVCGTYVVPEKAVTLVRGGQQIFFCSPECRSKYDR